MIVDDFSNNFCQVGDVDFVVAVGIGTPGFLYILFADDVVGNFMDVGGIDFVVSVGIGTVWCALELYHANLGHVHIGRCGFYNEISKLSCCFLFFRRKVLSWECQGVGVSCAAKARICCWVMVTKVWA